MADTSGAAEWIEAIAFDLATASRVVPPDEVKAAIAALRNEALIEAADVLDEIARKLDCFDDEQAQADAVHTQSCARAVRVYAQAIAARAVSAVPVNPPAPS